MVEIGLNVTTGHFNLGEIYKEQGKLDDAIDEFKKVIEIEPRGTEAPYNLACVYSLKNQPKLAIEYLQKTIDKLPKPIDPDDFIEFSKTDPDLENIRQTPEFQQLIDSY